MATLWQSGPTSRPTFGTHGRMPRRPTLQRSLVRNALVLVPTGDGSSAHIKGSKDNIKPPGELSLGSSAATFQLGGAPPADLVVDVPTVSTKHATLTVSDDGKVQVTDLGSTNGTTVGGKKIVPQQPQELPIGAEVSFGDDHLALFKLEDRPGSDARATPPASSK